ILSDGRIRAGVLMTPSTLDAGVLKEIAADELEIGHNPPLTAAPSDCWFYEMNAAGEAAELTAVRDADHLNELIAQVQSSDQHDAPRPAAQSVIWTLRDKVKQLVR
ncbi:MAG: hypothetical protein KDA63_09450, partial [Planctomycetales bacterium]|nr:hypothetical protein [Planctomycetales bacterium]